VTFVNAILLDMATVLFVCLQNAGRSQMSQALFERAAGDAHQALSGGTTPADQVHPQVVQVMRELDIDLGDRTPQLLTPELAKEADVVVTMGCGDQCPFIPGKRYIDWELPDPAGQPTERVRESPRRDRPARQRPDRGSHVACDCLTRARSTMRPERCSLSGHLSVGFRRDRRTVEGQPATDIKRPDTGIQRLPLRSTLGG
jgi:arsenate reductase